MGSFEIQARVADMLVVNRVDPVSPAERGMVEATLRALDPCTCNLPARFGIRVRVGEAVAPEAAHDHHRHDHGSGPAHPHMPDSAPCTPTPDGPCDPRLVQGVLDGACRGGIGDIERMKGIARMDLGWRRFDVAGGRTGLAVYAAIDRALEGAELAAALATRVRREGFAP